MLHGCCIETSVVSCRWCDKCYVGVLCLEHVLHVVIDRCNVSSNYFWWTRALSAFAKLYAALHMLFLRLLHINLSTDLFST